MDRKLSVLNPGSTLAPNLRTLKLEGVSERISAAVIVESGFF